MAHSLLGSLSKRRIRRERAALTQTDFDAVTEIAQAVVAYLEGHPGAADTTEGIKRWWLMRQLARYSQTRVQQALELLERKQAIERRVLGDGREVYARPQRRNEQ